MWGSFLVILCCTTTILGQGYYNVIGPRTIRPNSEYHCSISIQEASEPTSITAILQGTSYNGSGLFTQDQLVILPHSSKMCTLKVGDLEDGDYKLEVRGTGGVDFVTGFPLMFVKKSYSVFIQTDRQVYRPGSKILFRVIALNSALKPAAEVRDEPLYISISDGSGNQVKEWRNVKAPRGVFTGELKLSTSPVLGNWNVSVTIHDQTYDKTVEVAEYIYPKFVVDIDTPKHVTFKKNVIPVNINTRYSYGKKLHGEATVTVYPTIYSGVIQPIFQNPIRKVIQIDGVASVDFDIEKDLGLNDEYERTVVVDVTVEEQPTGRRQNNSVEVHIHKYDYQMNLIKTADYFKPGLPYLAYVKITDHDGNPVQFDRSEVTVRHGYSRTVDEVPMETKYQLDKKGVVKVEYVTPVNVTNTTALRIEAEFRDMKERLSPIPAAVSYNNIFLKLYLESVGDTIAVLVNCTEPMRYINYVLLGRGDVVISNTFQIDNLKEYRFSFRMLHAMAPLAHLYVYYTTRTGELIGDALDIDVGGTLQNTIDIQVNTLESEPDLDVEFLITSKPNSYIGLLTVDENVAKLRNGFDLTEEDVTEELKAYDPAIGSPYPRFAKDDLSQFSWSPGASNPHAGAYESGADLLTNAHIDRHNPTLEDIYLRPVFYGPSTIKPDRGLALPAHSVTRPPLAGPYAFSRIPRPVWNKPKVYLTHDVSPTWLFNNFSTGYDGKTSLRRKLPGSLTTWSISGFSLDPLYGLGLVNTPKKLRVSKSLVVTLDLPFSVQRGEILAVPIVVSNNMNQDVTVDVTLHNADQKFEFAEVSNEINGNETKKVEFYRRKKLNVKKNTGASISFMITTVKVGSVEIKVTANSPRTQDIVSKQLLVTPGGETEHYTKSVLLDLRTGSSLQKSINFTIPKNAVPDSEKIEVSVVGSFLGPAMVHLDDLMRLPTGCGEQNLVKFMPDVIILQYLRITSQSTPTIENEAISNLETSYQKQLTYKREDGSFSPFGSRDEVGSVWLTAYSALALRWAKTFIYIDNDIIDGALDWLGKAQGNNGSFYETGNVIHYNLQGRNGKSLALTAFVTMAFLESNQRNNPPVSNSINKALDYIAKNIDENETSYTLSLCSYALQLAKHPSKQSAFNLLDAKSRTTGNLKWWAEDLPDESKNPWRKLPRSIDVETTSYALLSFTEAGLLEDSVPILDWLENQQNSFGGFTSSHDTVVGLYALYKLVTRLGGATNMQVEFEDDRQKVGKYSINRNNIMILQSTEIGKEARMVNVTAQGTGLAIFRVSYKYNMNVTGPWPMFTLDPQVDKNTNRNHLQISICTAFVSQNLSTNPESNMAVMEVSLPSGFTADIDSLPSLEVSQNVQKVETSNSLTKIILYFNNITRLEYCPTISAFRTHKVAKQKPVPVVVYDYYDSSRRARVFYRGLSATLCDICEDEDCGDICVTESEPLKRSDGDGASTFTLSLVVLVLSAFAMFC